MTAYGLMTRAETLNGNRLDIWIYHGVCAGFAGMFAVHRTELTVSGKRLRGHSMEDPMQDVPVQQQVSEQPLQHPILFPQLQQPRNLRNLGSFPHFQALFRFQKSTSSPQLHVVSLCGFRPTEAKHIGIQRKYDKVPRLCNS